MGLNLFDIKLKEFGIPIEPPRVKMSNWNTINVVNFSYGNKSLIIMKEDCYEVCLQLTRLFLLKNLSKTIKWLPQSVVQDIEGINQDLVVLIELYNEPVEHRKRFAGAIVNKVLGYGGQVLIGCKDKHHLESSFPYDLDTLENRFDVWKDKK